MQSNESLIQYLQVWFGYALTGDVSEHAVSFFYGAGANGKSTLLEVIRYVMGDYASTAAPGLLMAKRNDQHPTEIADLLGKRLVVTGRNARRPSFQREHIQMAYRG
jgi:putative DNA primase/helicase